MSTFFTPSSSWKDKDIWLEVANHEGMNNPFEAKCLYVFGTIRHLLYAAHKLYPDHSLPACILGFNAIELLGRCLKGDPTDQGDFKKRIKCGLRYIARINDPNRPKKLYISEEISYDVPSDILVKIRNLTAHGFYGSDKELQIDKLLIAWLFGAIGDAIQRYYKELEQGEKHENMLKAKIQPLVHNGKPTRIKPIRKDINDRVSLSRPGGKLRETPWKWDDDYEMVKHMKKNKWFLSL